MDAKWEELFTNLSHFYYLNNGHKIIRGTKCVFLDKSLRTGPQVRVLCPRVIVVLPQMLATHTTPLANISCLVLWVKVTSVITHQRTTLNLFLTSVSLFLINRYQIGIPGKVIAINVIMTILSLVCRSTSTQMSPKPHPHCSFVAGKFA